LLLYSYLWILSRQRPLRFDRQRLRGGARATPAIPAVQRKCSEGTDGSPSYLVHVERSDLDALGGRLTRLKRAAIERGVNAGAVKGLAALRDRLESKPWLPVLRMARSRRRVFVFLVRFVVLDAIGILFNVRRSRFQVQS